MATDRPFPRNSGQSLQEYRARINRVMDYIDSHIDQPADLAVLARVAHFSPYHFHRIFTVMTGETPNHFLLRLRVEKAARWLKESRHVPVSEVAVLCGFNDSSTFCRAFKKHFGLTPTAFRQSEKGLFALDGHYYSKNGQWVRKKYQSPETGNPELHGVEFKLKVMKNTPIEIKEMPEMNVVYVRHVGEFKGVQKAYEKLFRWAGPRGLLNFPGTKVLGVYHDDPAVTELEKVRQSACLTVTGEVKVDGEIGRMTIPGGKFAVGHFDIDETEFEAAWNTMCLWFSGSGYEPADGISYELYYNHASQEDPQYKRFVFDICMPVKPL